MDNSTPSRRRTVLDLPKVTDAGLAEWANKIKTIQREVDGDAEDEQRKLQEEIERSRLERARRRNTASIDWTKSSKPSSEISTQSISISSRNDIVGERRIPQVDAPDKASGASEVNSNIAKESISLAAFMGSRATGPRLNKHAPQVNSHDPELFDMSKHDGPHPVFGKPLVRSPSKTQLTDKLTTPPSRPQTETPPPLASEKTPISSQKPIPTPPLKPKSLAEIIGGQGSGPRLTKSQPTNENDEVTNTRGISVSQGRALPGMSSSQSPRPVLPSLAFDPAEPSRSSQAAHPTRRAPSPVVVPSLARPIQPQVNVSVSPSVPVFSTPAPAFLRPIPTTEELHPSLTKLQGRGIVGQRVKAATVLTEPSSSETEERTSTSSPNLRKRPSVLDRWQPVLSSSPSRTTPTEMAKTPERAKSAPASGVGNIRRELPGMNVGTTPPRKSSNTTTERTSEVMKGPPIRLPGMVHEDAPGNTSTSIQVRAASPSSIPVASESVPLQKTSSNMASTTLNHPTRDRAKKPRKEKNIRNAADRADDQQDTVVSNKPFISRVNISNDPPSQDSYPKIQVFEPEQHSTPIDVPISPALESPKSPNRHGRIPSTGQRATVMDVAQALLERKQNTFDVNLEMEKSGLQEEEEEEVTRPDVKAMVAGWGQFYGHVPTPEKRKSGYERYSVVAATTLPPLVEVQTPVETPQATLTRNIDQEQAKIPSARALQEQLQKLDLLSKEDEAGLNQTASKTVVRGQGVEEEKEESAELIPQPEPSPQPLKNDEDEMVEIVFQTKLPPPFNPQQVIKETPFTPNLNVQTISIEINVISGGTAMTIAQEQNIFYNTEVIVVVYRSKEKSSELVSNKTWIWRGMNSNWTREERKATELAERFDRKPVICMQGAEPAMLIHVLGGVLATRQGTRSHWSVENTTMHRVHRIGDCIFVDEVDLGVWNLCSGYSYCFSILGTLYVWHGRGSSEDERKVALTYAATLSRGVLQVVEFEEGSEDEVFWMILGQTDYANAHHWKFRNTLDRLGARIYAVDSSKTKTPVQALLYASARDLQDGVFVVDCRLEIYIVIKAEARGKHTDIQLALFLAENISSTASPKRPFSPPVHVVILPSKLPLELRAALRFCDEASMNGGKVPEHMNVVSLGDAVDHLHCRAWPRSRLTDPNFLPLGVDPTMIS